MPFGFFLFCFFTISEFMIACMNMCEGIRMEVGARIHDEILKVPSGKLRVENAVGCLYAVC